MVSREVSPPAYLSRLHAALVEAGEARHIDDVARMSGVKVTSAWTYVWKLLDYFPEDVSRVRRVVPAAVVELVGAIEAEEAKWVKRKREREIEGRKDSGKRRIGGLNVVGGRGDVVGGRGDDDMFVSSLSTEEVKNRVDAARPQWVANADLYTYVRLARRLVEQRE